MFGLHELKEIINELDRSSVSELTFENNGMKVALKKNIESKQTHANTQNNNKIKVKEESNSLKEITSDITSAEQAAAGSSSDNVTEIVSPMVGTFYRKPSPEADSYVNVGEKVNSETVVCIVEAMKLFNEIEAETTGEISEILVEDGALVEYGQPLFKVKLD